MQGAELHTHAPRDRALVTLIRGGDDEIHAGRGSSVFTTLLALPVPGYAQEARLSGTVADSTGGVLPGVTVTVVHVATGHSILSSAAG